MSHEDAKICVPQTTGVSKLVNYMVEFSFLSSLFILYQINWCLKMCCATLCVFAQDTHQQKLLPQVHSPKNLKTCWGKSFIPAMGSFLSIRDHWAFPLPYNPYLTKSLYIFQQMLPDQHWHLPCNIEVRVKAKSSDAVSVRKGSEWLRSYQWASVLSV